MYLLKKYIKNSFPKKEKRKKKLETQLENYAYITQKSLKFTEFKTFMNSHIKY